MYIVIIVKLIQWSHTQIFETKINVLTNQYKCEN